MLILHREMIRGSNTHMGLNGSCQKRHGRKKKGGVQWDEQNLEENERIKLELNPTKIDEPKTPYHRNEEDEDDSLRDDGLEMSPLSLTDTAGSTRSNAANVGRRRTMFEEQLEHELEHSNDIEKDQDKKKKFLEARKQHYKVGRHLLSTQEITEDQM